MPVWGNKHDGESRGVEQSVRPARRRQPKLVLGVAESKWMRIVFLNFAAQKVNREPAVIHG